MVTAFGERVTKVRVTTEEDEHLCRRLRECREFFAAPELVGTEPARVTEALEQLADTGTYTHTADEILIGAKLAWRNHARCVGRSHWRSLVLVDRRDASTAAEVADACWEHLRVATNDGALRSVITVGPVGDRFRIVSSQIVRYAGYRADDGSVVGDPANIALTDLATGLGWTGDGTAFDILPLLISDAATGRIHRFDVPRDLVVEVPLAHPEYAWFAELGLRWHAVPAVAAMDLEIGGITYSCAPFSGWYVSTEIGARNFSDPDRYDMLPTIAENLWLDMSSERTLWRDRALVELNRAVIHSFRDAGVVMVDHHTVARQFVDHVEREKKAGRACPTDWSWVNPPMSASLTPTFHRYYDDPDMTIRPNFVSRRGAGGCPMGR